MARWQRHGTTLVSRHVAFDVFRHEVSRAGGTARQIHTLETVDWCNVVPLTDDGRVILVRLHRFGIDAPSLEIPGGMIDDGEEPLESARRELLEETGHRCDEIVPLGTVFANPALQKTRLHMFLARGCRPDPAGQSLDELEDCEVEVVDREELERRLDSGDIGHALVWAALHAWHRFEQREQRDQPTHPDQHGASKA
jgi:ADP-ribose pyrophosphatase